MSLAPGEEGILGRRIPWGGRAVTATGKKLELGLGFSYFGLERAFPGSSGLGEPMGEAWGKRPGGGRVARRRGVSGEMGESRPGTGAWGKFRKKVLLF